MVGGKGLKLEVPVFNIAGVERESFRVAVLGGTTGRTEDRPPLYVGILIRKIHEGHYICCRNVPLMLVLSLNLKQTDLQTIYIRSNQGISRRRSLWRTARQMDNTGRNSRVVDVEWLLYALVQSPCSPSARGRKQSSIVYDSWNHPALLQGHTSVTRRCFEVDVCVPDCWSGMFLKRIGQLNPPSPLQLI